MSTFLCTGIDHSSAANNQDNQSVCALIKAGENKLESRLEAELLLAKVLSVTRTQLYQRLDAYLSLADQRQFLKLLTRRVQGEPIAYILGQREFWSLELKVNDSVLIPRPETELLIEVLFQYYEKTQKNIRILDLGTGSGAIAIAIAAECSEWDILASDLSSKALEVAKENSERLGLKNITFLQGDWYHALPLDMYKEYFDVIISNPPYIAEDSPYLKQGDLQFEPEMALSSGENGLRDLKTIIQDAPLFLKPTGVLLVEQGFDQAQSVAKLMEKRGLIEITAFKDLAGINRVTMGCNITS